MKLNKSITLIMANLQGLPAETKTVLLNQNDAMHREFLGGDPLL